MSTDYVHMRPFRWTNLTSLSHCNGLPPDYRPLGLFQGMGEFLGLRCLNWFSVAN